MMRYTQPSQPTGISLESGPAPPFCALPAQVYVCVRELGCLRGRRLSWGSAAWRACRATAAMRSARGSAGIGVGVAPVPSWMYLQPEPLAHFALGSRAMTSAVAGHRNHPFACCLLVGFVYGIVNVAAATIMILATMRPDFLNKMILRESFSVASFAALLLTIIDGVAVGLLTFLSDYKKFEDVPLVRGQRNLIESYNTQSFVSSWLIFVFALSALLSVSDSISVSGRVTGRLPRVCDQVMDCGRAGEPCAGCASSAEACARRLVSAASVMAQCTWTVFLFGRGVREETLRSTELNHFSFLETRARPSRGKTVRSAATRRRNGGQRRGGSHAARPQAI